MQSPRKGETVTAKSRAETGQAFGDPSQRLRDDFGLSSFHPGQRAVIDRLLAGKNAAAVFPTGGGKSLCYQLPALLFPGATIVISPLIALMKDQCDALHRRGIAAARIDSTLSQSEVYETMQAIRGGDTKLLYVAPERFFNERFRAAVGDLRVSLFAIDEAHCISRWGHNFRPDYLKLADLARELCAERVLALTATATPEVLEDICSAFSIASDDAIRTPFFRRNLQLQSSVVDEDDRDSRLLGLIRDCPPGPAIVYVSLQRTAETVAAFLADAGLPTRAYHAGMDDEVRSQTQQWFIESPRGIVVATIAFGMGIDKPNIRYIYHYNPSSSLESYAQEIGRAGRDGLDSYCHWLICPNDRIVLENFVYGDTPTRQSVGQLIDLVDGQAESFFISYYQLAAETDIRLLVARTLMTYLELDGYLVAKSPRFDTYKIKPLVASTTILANFNGEKRAFLAALLGCLTKGRTWYLLNMAVAGRRLNCDRGRMVAAIEYLAEKGWIDVQVSDLVHGYQKRNPIGDRKLVADRLFDQLLLREQGELSRLNSMMELGKASSCLARTLSSHFGEEIGEDCGRCTHCLGGGPNQLPPVLGGRVGTSVLKSIEGLTKRYPDLLGTPRQRARFLCGLTSPAFTRARLSRDPSFGICDRVPFAAVLQAVSTRNDS